MRLLFFLLPLALATDCMTPLHRACETGDSERVRSELEFVDANLDDACEGKVRPLMLAAEG